MIGRSQEIEVLKDALASNRPEFIVVYGRRRVGKTFLIKEFFDDTFSFYATGVQNLNTKQELRVFKEALAKYGDREKTVPKDWFEAFSRLEEVLKKETVHREYKSGKRVVFLDELPWMDTPRSEFKSALDYFWNSWASSQKDLVLIVCGSATSWIMDNIVKDTGGFYNRITKQIHLLPFSLKEAEELLESNKMRLSRKQIVEAYMVFGGIPYYLNYLKPGYSVAQNIEMLFFNENGPLKYEFTQLFASLFKKSDNYVQIIKELAKSTGGRTRNELISGGKTVSGKELTKCLENLEQCGFIRKYSDFSTEKKGAHYQLIDPLCLFYLNIIEGGKVDSWLDFVGTPVYYNWCGLSFEKVCILHIAQIKNALGISGVTSREFAWQAKKGDSRAQIDLLIDRKDEVINVCEIKYTKDEYEIDAAYEKELATKMEAFRRETKTKKALWLTMISFAGVKENKYEGVLAKELTGEDLFS